MQKEKLIYLEPNEHVYIHKKTGKKYTSVTKAIALIEPHFDEDGVASAIANQSNDKKQERYIGMTKEQILEYWTFLNDEANIYGTKVHDIIETYLKAKKIWFPKDPLAKKVIEEFSTLDIDEGIEMYPERIMFSEKYEIAGMSDLVIDINDFYFDIGDWKGLSIDTPIFTNNGWKTMGTLSLFDKVYDMDGNQTSILHISKIKNNPCYKIIFNNNEEVICDFEHRWLISFYSHKKFNDFVMTCTELYEYFNKLKNTNNKKSYELPKVKICKPLNNDKIKLPIDPYVFGVWLGNGHSADGKITNMHDEIWGEIKKRGYEIGNDVSGGGTGKASTRTVFGLHKELNSLKLLKNKHIPNIFLYSSYEQRLDLLRGFMDADGHYHKKRKRFVMATTKPWQRKAFIQLISSLGFKGTTFEFYKKFKGKRVKVYDILFSTDGINPFLSRNKEIIYTKRNRSSFKNIKSIEIIDSVPTRCIEVDSPTKTYLYGDTFSVTHNTNKAFNFYNQYGYETLLPPFDYWQNCQFSIYTIQLSIYAYMYELEYPHKKCRRIWIGYWNKETEKFTKIPILYAKTEAKKLLELHKFNLDYK